MSTQAHNAASPEYDLAAALASLPSCSRCRRRRIKCDSLVPACLNCEKAEKSCEYPDHVLDRPVSRGYVASLTSRYDELMAMKAELSANRSTTVGDTPGSTSSGGMVETPWITASASGSSDESYWGPSSAYTKLGTLIRIQGRIPDLPPKSSSFLPGLLEALPLAQAKSITIPSLEVCKQLVDVYHSSIETFYPVFGWAYSALPVPDVFHEEAGSHICRPMLLTLLAISMQLLGRGEPHYLDHARQYFNASQREGGLILSKLPTLERLQALTLICIYHMLSLEQTNIWQYLNLANLILIENEQLIREAKMLHLYSTIASLDVDVSAAYGRSAALRSPDIVPMKEDYEGSCDFAFLVHQLMDIRQRIHGELMVTAPKASRGDLCEVGSGFRRDLSGWLMDWNLVLSSPIHNTRKTEWIQSIGAVLYDQALLHVLEIPEIGSKDVRERRNVAARFIYNCHQLFFFDVEQSEAETRISDGIWIYPFFWTHAHSILKAVLVVLQYGQDSQDDEIPRKQAVTLLLKLDPSQKLFHTLWSLRQADPT